MTVWGYLRRGGRFAVGSCALLLGLLCATFPATADTIIDVRAGSLGPSVNEGQFESQGWTQTQTYDDVSIFVALSSWTPGAVFDITAYLTNAIGPLAVSPPIATVSFSGETPDSTPKTFSLFSGLTLTPGTYYLTLSSTDNTGGEPGALWPTECSSGCPMTLDSGVTLLSQFFVNEGFGVEDLAYAPASTFEASSPALNLTVTGNDSGGYSSLPEPATCYGAIIGLAGLLAGLKLRGRRA